MVLGVCGCKVLGMPVELIEKELVYGVVGCALEVLNEIGHGFREKTYENALCIALHQKQIDLLVQQRYPVCFNGIEVDSFVPDLVVAGKLILEVKTVDALTDQHIGQLLNYLRVTRLQAGVLLNFRHPKLEWKRIVLTQ